MAERRSQRRSLGRLLRIRRGDLRLSVADMAGRTGTDVDTIAGIEAGTCGIPPGSVEDFASSYELDADEFLLAWKTG